MNKIKLILQKIKSLVQQKIKFITFSVFLLTIILFFGYSKLILQPKKINTNGIFIKEININGLNRRYAIYIPKNTKNTPTPLVFELHGGGVSLEDEIGKSHHKTPYKLWMNIAEKEKFIIVYPEGLPGAYGKPTWNDCRKDCIVNSDTDDVHFINELINNISSRYNIDSSRVYVSGTSNGGFMAQRIGIELNDKIAAVASIVAGKPAISKCDQPIHPISILFMNGTNDNHMPYGGGYLSNPPSPDHGSVLSTKKTIAYWVRFNQTDTTPNTYTFPDLDVNDGGIVEKYSYKNGLKNTEVVSYKINGAGHSAPSIKEHYSKLFEKYFGKQNHDIEMTTEVWNFFKNQKLTQ